MSTEIPPNHSLLGRAFDAYQNMMQIAACIREAARQQGKSQPRVLELSRRETGLRDYLPAAQLTRFATHDGHEPALPDPLILPWPDGSFDVSLVSDMYEHVPASARPALLREMLRVTNGLVMLAAPQQNELVTRFDRVVFDFIWGKYAERFEPLAQHVEFGLEPIEQTLASFRTLGADQVIALPCNFVYRWIHQILIFFDLQHKHPHFDLYEPLNRIYNEQMAAYDYREPCYRYLVAVATSPAINVEVLQEALRQPAAEPAGALAAAEGAMVKVFHQIEARTADRLRLLSANLEQASQDNAWAHAEHQRLLSIIEQLQQDNAEANKENFRLLAMIEQLQQDNAGATEENARLLAIIEQLQRDNAWVSAELARFQVAEKA